MTAGTAANTQSGPGNLYWAPLGTAEPGDLVDAWPTGWVQLGYTESGSVDESDYSSVDLDVEEELEPVDVKTTKITRKITFALAEITAINLARVNNADPSTAVIDVETATGPPAIAAHVYFEPGNTGSEVRAMLGWISDDATERIVWRECLQVGKISRNRSKSKLSTFSVEYRILLPKTGLRPFIERFADSRIGA